jgi:hypothetical protein
MDCTYIYYCTVLYMAIKIHISDLGIGQEMTL